jgi:PLP dependent protein
MLENVVKNLSVVQSDIQAVFEHYFLLPKPTQIIVVTKTQPIDAIIPLLEMGHRVFGENRILEAFEKWQPLKARYPDIELHLIGSLQGNKVKKALQIFDVIQTVDRISLIDDIIKYKDIIKNHKFFIQINTGKEPQKSGVLINDFSDLLSYSNNHGIKISGLMCIPPARENATHHFAIMHSLARQNGSLKLSAGMSSDYLKAVLYGTDYVRIGTAIFEKNDTNNNF